MPASTDAVAIAAYSLAQQILVFLNKKQVIVDDELYDLLKVAIHPLIGTTGGPQLNAEAGRIVGELSRSLLPQAGNRQGT